MLPIAEDVVERENVFMAEAKVNVHLLNEIIKVAKKLLPAKQKSDIWRVPKASARIGTCQRLFAVEYR